MNGFVRSYQSWGVRATGLKSDTTYYYQVGCEGHYSPIQSFTTAPAEGDLTLAFYGDIQGAYNQFPEAIKALEGRYPDIDLNLQAGDVSDDGQAYSDWTNAYSGFGSYLSSHLGPHHRQPRLQQRCPGLYLVLLRPGQRHLRYPPQLLVPGGRHPLL